MSKPRIAYIDEEMKAIRSFQRKFDADFAVEGLLPPKDINDLIEKIFKLHVDAVVTDFNLKEYKTDVKYPVNYDGVQLVELIRAIRHDFPCFVLTSYDTDAIQEANDVNLIYPKDALMQKVGNTTLQERVTVQIKHYRAALERNSAEFDALLEKSQKQQLTEAEEARLAELDALIETSLDKRRAVKRIAKESGGVKKLNELLANTDALLNELRKEKKK